MIRDILIRLSKSVPVKGESGRTLYWTPNWAGRLLKWMEEKGWA